MIARRCHVSGRVQGVFYRASTREQAMRLGLAGYARNLDDGRVEVLVVGEHAAVARLIDWLHVGPPAASVKAVVIQEIGLQEFDELPTGFGTR
ncbi:MAG: acylphosphatase [Steroidobacteraceae bacterium]